MRKLLIFAVVLGMASMASAVPVLTVSDDTPTLGDTFYLYVSGTASEATGDGGTPTGGYATMITLDYANYATYVIDGYNNANPYISIQSGDPTSTPEAGGGLILGTTYGNQQFIAAPPGGDWAEATDVDTGLWLTYELYADALGTTLVGMTADWGSEEIGALSITVVPEPITMALLGLGGLFLRRRK